MIESELASAICDFADTLRKFEVLYLLGGSFASSLHGVFRTTNDIDVLVGKGLLTSQQALMELDERFIVDTQGLTKNFSVGRAFNIFHQASACCLCKL